MNIKFLLATIIFTSVCFLGGIAQTSGWESGVNLSGGTSFAVRKNFGNNNPWVYGTQSKPIFQYSAGAYGRKFFKEKFGIEFGVQYTSMGVGANYEGIFTDEQGNPMGTYKLRFADRLNYVEIPVHFVFKQRVGRFDLGFYAGVAPALLTHAYTRSVSHVMGERHTEKYSIAEHSRRFNLFADAGFLFRVNVTDHFAIDLKPYFRASTLPVYDAPESNVADRRLLSTGISVATVWKF